MKRSERFQQEYLENIENLIQIISPHIQLKYKDLPEETRHANLAVAEFIKVIRNLSILTSNQICNSKLCKRCQLFFFKQL